MNRTGSSGAVFLRPYADRNGETFKYNNARQQRLCRALFVSNGSSRKMQEFPRFRGRRDREIGGLDDVAGPLDLLEVCGRDAL